MSYDDTQAGAQLVTCAACGRAWYMTHPQPICVKCREQAAKAEQ